MYTPELTRKHRLGRREAITGYLFASPWLIGLLVFTLYPMLSSLYYSFTNYNLSDQYKWVGLKNYIVLFTNDASFPQAIGNTLYYALLSVPLSLVLGLGIAMLMNQKIPGIKVFRTVFYLPNVISIVAVCMIWRLIFQAKYGVLNQFLGFLGIVGPQWLSSGDWTKPALIILSCWCSGSSMVIYLAALQNVPRHYYEAVEIDGANFFQKFWHITLPMMSSTIFFQLINGMIFAMQMFMQASLMLSSNGSVPPSATFLVGALYNNAFSNRRMGYACAMGWVLLVMVLALTLLIFKGIGSKVYYETGDES